MGARNLCACSCYTHSFCHALGFFEDGERAWLANFEAGTIMQVPTGVFVLFPSALQTHCNADLNGENISQFFGLLAMLCLTSSLHDRLPTI